MISPKVRAFVATFVVSLGLDQWTKFWARANLKPIFPDTVKVIPGYFELRFSENTGTAFSLFRDSPLLPIVLAVAGLGALTLVITFLRRAPAAQWRFGAELGLLAGGALGNIVDRIFLRKVTDFIVWRAGTHEWPTFNIADAALVIGVGLMFFEKNPLDVKPAEKNEKK